MTSQVHIDPLRASEVFHAWGNPQESSQIAMVGHDMLDGLAFGLLKAEFLAAQAGVVPFIPLPGGGSGVMTVGGAIGTPSSKWPQSGLRDLYILNHKCAASMHAGIRAARATTPELEVSNPKYQTGMMQSSRNELFAAGPANMGILPAAWIVVAAIGILATVAGAYYATRTTETKIQVEAKLASDQYKTGMLTDLAQQQLLTQGKIDPELVRAIRDAGSSTSWNVWPWVAVGSGTAIAAATGTYLVVQKNKGRRR